MNNFLLALQFLTILPIRVNPAPARMGLVKDAGEKNMAYAAAYFPLVGLLLGAILVLVNALLGVLNIPLMTANIILVVALLIITGGMHLDGLSDTADALLSGKSKDEMLSIMRDPHIGVMGTISIISILFLKITFLFSINPSLIPTALILICVLSRWSLVFSLFLFPYARQEGKAKVFT